MYVRRFFKRWGEQSHVCEFEEASDSDKVQYLLNQMDLSYDPGIHFVANEAGNRLHYFLRWENRWKVAKNAAHT